jgi:DNA-binding transcriptional regulator YiaG
MNKEEYNQTLKDIGLSKKELANILGVAEQTVNNWGSTNKVPYWIKSWLQNYIKAKDFDTIVDTVKPYFESDK